MSSNRFALIIANDQYEDESLSKLEAPKFDAYALAEVLGDPETCNFYVQLAVNKKSYTVNQLIESFFDNRKRDSLLLLYFSGHGIKDEDGQLYFATPNTRQNRLLSTAVSASLVNKLMRRTRSRSQILLLDCCYSGAFAKGMIAKSGSAIGSKIGTNDYFQGRGRVVLTASDSMQYAFEEDKLVEKGSVNSIFTSAIVEGIRTWDADDNNDNRISIQELYDYVDEYVQERTPNQQPVMWSFNTRGEMIIAEREYAPEMDDEVVEYVFEKQAIMHSEETRELQIQYEAKLEALHMHASKLADTSSIEEIAEYTIEVMYATLGMKSCDFYIREDQILRLKRYRGWIPDNPNRTFPLDGPGILVKTANTKKTILLSDIRKEPDYYEYGGKEVEGEEAYQPLSELCVPVISDGEVVAILNTESNQLDFYDERDQRLLETLASHVASAIQRIRLLEKQSEYESKLEALHMHASKLADASSIEETAEYSIEEPPPVALEYIEPVQPVEVEQQPEEVEQPPVEIEHVETVQPSIEIEQPLVETEQASQEVQPPVETVQPSAEIEQPPMELEPPPVEIEHVETMQPPVEVELPPVETAPLSQVQVSAELVTPSLEEPTESKKFPVKPALLVAIILVAIIGIAYWSGIGPFARTTDVEGGGTGALVIEDFSVDGFTLSWSVSGAPDVSIDQGIGSVALSGTIVVSPDETTTYTLTASKGDTSTEATKQVTVEVPVVEFFLTTGGSTLRWSVSGATDINIDQGIGSVASSGSTTVSPDETTTYTLTASKGGRSTEATVQVVVEESRDPVVEYFTSEGSTLSWSVSGAIHVSINQGIGGVAASGTVEVDPRETTTYTLTADNFYGIVYAFRTVVVTQPSLLPDVIKIGYIASSSSALDTAVPLVEEIITPDLDAYADSLGLDVTFEFIIESADSQASVHLEKVQEFKAMGVDIFIGGPWSSMAQASLSYVNDNDMLMVSSSSTSQLLAIENDRLFRVCPTDAVQAPAIGAMWDSWGADAVLIVQRGDFWGDGIYDDLVPELEARDIEVIGRVRYAPGVTDFSSYLSTMDSLLENAIAEYGADRVGVQTIMFDEAVELVSQTSAFPDTRKVIWMGTENSGRTQRMIDEAGGKQVDLRIFSPIMSPPDSPEWESFESQYYDLTSNYAGFYEATAYDAAWVLAKSLLQTGSVDAGIVADALPDVSDDHYGVSGLVTLDKYGDREPGFFNIWGFADNSAGFTLYGTFDGNTKNIVWDDAELIKQGVSRPD